MSKVATLIHETEKIINGRYILHEQIGQGGMGIVYKATDRLTGSIVALKQVIVDEAANNERFRLALAKEFQLLAGLRHPYVISVLDYGFDGEKQPFFTMTYLPEAQNLLTAARGASFERKIELVEQLLQGLVYLHRRGILHRDIKPENVVVVGGTVRLLDFGLSQNAGEEGAMGGSAPYMAPELIDGDEATFASDLYAVGVLLCELMVGYHPYGPFDKDFYSRLFSIEPNLSDVDLRIQSLLEKMLAIAPNKRPSNATAALGYLAEALGKPPQKETEAIRESYLQAAAFVGRKSEMEQLVQALEKAKDGESSFWLMGGESGVGKSRLIDEFRTRALVDGWQVVQGRGISNGEMLYYLWRELVPQLVIQCNLTDLEAGILKELMPNIGRLLGRDIPTPPPLEGPANQQRLTLTLLTVLQRQSKPTLLILEDLHWLRESLSILEQVSSQLSRLPNLMILATYRSDERPNLPAELPSGHLMLVERLHQDEVTELVGAMLGTKEYPAKLSTLLTQETEGNTFFIVEVMRALAAETDNLQEVQQMVLPDKVLTNGMQSLLQRRIQMMSEEAQAILQLAAVDGRELDLSLLKTLAPKTNLSKWLQTALDHNILTVRETQWRFSHDKIRETILFDLDPTDRKQLHEQIAAGIEQIYHNDPLYYPILLDHWHRADCLDKELIYLPMVVTNLIEDVGDYNRANELTVRGLDRLAAENPQRLPLLSLHSKALIRLADFDEAGKRANEAKRLAQQTENLSALAQSFVSLGEICYRQGNAEESRTNYQQALSVLDQAKDRLLMSECLEGLGQLASAQGEYEEAFQYNQRSLAIRQEIGEEQGIFHSLNNLGILRSRQERYQEALEYYEPVLEYRQLSGDQRGVGRGNGNLGIIKSLYFGEYGQASDHFHRAIEIFQLLGEKWNHAFALSFLGYTEIQLGKPDQARQSLIQALEIARSIDSKPLVLHSMVSFATLHYLQGELDRAAELVGLIQPQPEANQDVQLLLMRLLSTLKQEMPETKREEATSRGELLDLNTTEQALFDYWKKSSA